MVIFAKTRGLEPAELTNNILTELGYGVAGTNPAGVVTNHTYRFDVIVCTVDFRVNDPDNHGITCWVGDDATTVISTQDIDTMQLKIQEGAKEVTSLVGRKRTAIFNPTTARKQAWPDYSRWSNTCYSQTDCHRYGWSYCGSSSYTTITVTLPDHRSPALAEIAPKLAEAGGVTLLCYFWLPHSGR